MNKRDLLEKLNYILWQADEETLHGYAMEWLIYIAKQNPQMFEEEYQKYVAEETE